MKIKIWDSLNNEEDFADEVEIDGDDDEEIILRRIEQAVLDWAEDQSDHWADGCENLCAYVRLPDNSLSELNIGIEYYRSCHINKYRKVDE